MSDETRTSASAYAPRYASLEDYLHVIRRRRLMIAVLTALGIIVGIAIAVTRTDAYTASASLSFRDISQDLRSFGVDALPETPPEVLANVNAELITRPEITNRVARALEGEVPREALAGAVRGRVATRTGFVIISATAADPESAALIANAYADAAVAVGTRQVRQRLRGVVEELDSELERIESADPEDLGAAIGFRLTVLEGQLSRVRTLLAVAEPVQVATRGAPPRRPDSMGPASSGAIGGLIGLLLGLIGAFTRDALDRRVRNAHEVHRELDRAVLGRIPESALGFPGLLQNGAEPMWDSDFEAFRALRTNLGYLNAERPNGQPVRCLLVTSAMPEEGKSTVSMSLASAAATAGQRVLLIEGDLRRPCFAKRLDIPPAPGLCDYLRGASEPADIVRTVDLTQPRPSAITRPQAPAPADAADVTRLACVVAGRAAADSAELLLDPRLGEMLEVVRRAYDLVIIDSSPMLAVADPLELVKHVDAVLVCVRAHASTHDEVRALRSVLSTLPDRPTSAVVTGLRRDGPDSYEYYYGY